MPTVIVFGNPDLPMDSLPLRLVPELKKQFPETAFLVLDPNEEWPFDAARGESGEFTVIDTVLGIEKITVFDDLDHFTVAPRLSVHDFDALAYMLYLRKLGKVKKVAVIGVPPTATPDKVIATLATRLSELQTARRSS